MSVLTVFASSYYADGSLAAWTDPTNVYANDGSYATRAGSSKNIWYGNLFGFDLSSLPDNAVINSVTISAEWHNSANDAAGPVLLLGAQHNGSEIGSNTDTSGQTTDEVLTYSPTGLTASQLKATGSNGFLAILRFRRIDNTAHTASVDYVKIDIDYSELTHYTLTAETGSFAEAGQATVLKASRVLPLAKGDFTLSGINATLTVTQANHYTLTASAGLFTVDGQAGSLKASRKIVAGYGAFTESGQSAQLLVGRVVDAQVQSYSLTGIGATLSKQGLNHYVLSAQVGLLTASGIPVSLLTSRRITASQGSFASSGVSANVLRGLKITAEVRNYFTSGFNAGLLVGRRLNSETGILSGVGKDAILLLARKLSASSALLTLTGIDATFYREGVPNHYVLTASPGLFTTSGVDAALVSARKMLTEGASLSIEGIAPDLLYGRYIAGEMRSIILTGETAALTADRKLVGGRSDLSVTGVASNMYYDRVLYCEHANLLLSGVDANLIASGAVLVKIIQLSLFNRMGINQLGS